MDDLKGNPIKSDKSNQGPHISNPVTTNVVVKKESEAKRFGKSFFSEDAKTVGSHVRDDVVIPSAKKLLSDVVKSAIDWLLYGSKGSRNVTGVGNISYGSYYTRNGLVNANPIPASPSPMIQPQKPTLYSVNDVIIYDRGDAEAVLLNMQKAIQDYGMVSVADFYQLVNQKFEPNDNNWGWFDLKTAEIMRVDNGFSIRFPKIQHIGQN